MIGITAAALCAGGLGASGAIAAAPTTVTVAGQPTVPQGASTQGAVASSSAISGDIGLKPRNAAALAAYAQAVSTPGSSQYHNYLTLAQFNAEYAPSAATVAAVTSALKAGGLSVGSVSGDNLLVSFSGPASDVTSTFHTGLRRYRLNGGREAYANTSGVQLPASVAADVQNITGLNDLVVPHADPPSVSSAKGTPSGSSASVPSGAAAPCAAATKTANLDSGLTADSVAHAYGLDPLYSAGDFGSGQKVDILDLYGYNQSDVAAYDNCYYGSTEGAQVLSRLSSTNVDGGAQTDTSGAGGTGETELDVESVAAYAPQAQVDVFEAPSTDPGFLDDIAAMTDDTASKIESISYGECEPDVLAEEPGYAQLENTLFEQAAIEGKTVLASSADNGSDTCSADSGGPVAPLLSASDPSSQPYVTSVGGTAITAATDPPSEEVWNDGSAGGAGGGGISDIWHEPSWQADSKVPGLNSSTIIGEAEKVNGNDFCQTGSSTSTSTPCRELPDVSAQASPNTGGFVIYLGGQWTVIGGTSLSSPTWAAILADINSTASCVARGGVGFVSPALYSIASDPTEYAASFNDITVGNNDNFGAADGLFGATTGYDMATGLGSPKVTGADGANGLAYYLCGGAVTAAPTVSSVTPSALSSSAVSQGTSLTVYGSGFESGSTPDVAGVTIGTVTVPAADISVKSAGELVVDPVPATMLQTGTGGTLPGEGTYDVSVSLTGGASSTPGRSATLVIYPSSGSSSTPTVSGTFPSAGVESGGTKVTIYGSGFSEAPITSVTFGGVAAQSYAVVNDNEISAVVPAYGSGTTCGASDTPSTGTCQTAVKVSTATASSPEPAIPAEYSGPLADATSTGTYPAPNEFDYEPAPHITSISYAAAPDLASEAGGTVVTINGTGFGDLGLDWVNVGPYTTDLSQVLPTSVSSTQLTITLPPQTATSTELQEPVTVQTAGSPNQAPGVALTSVPPSNAVNVDYAPTPSVTGVSTSGSVAAGPTSGGTPLTLTGSGFTGADEVVFVDQKYGFESTQHSLDVVSNSEITLDTPAALTGVYGIEVCGVSGCSAPSTATFTYYVQGAPSVTSVKPTSGPAGTRVVITGENLGYVQAVDFGSTPATTFHNAKAFFEGGNTTKVIAFAPAGTSGKTVAVRVTTLESVTTGSGRSPKNPMATFTYTG